MPGDLPISVSRSADVRDGLGAQLPLKFRWPDEAPGGQRDNFFLGAWHPRRRLRIDWNDQGSSTRVGRCGPNWALISPASPLHPAGTGLVHQADDRSIAVAFRGYVLPRLQSYASSADIVEYWGANVLGQHNGVFSAAVIDGGGRCLTLLTDVLGMGPLYYRTLDEVVLFSTNPRYLVADGDRPDLVAWRCLLQAGWIANDRSLSEGVRRVPAGHAIRFSAAGQHTVAWFDFETLGCGERPVGPRSVGEVEEVFQQAIDRCLRLRTEETILPLSSGFDSRRILAALLRRASDFSAVTCRVLQKGYRDLDARFAQEMAAEFRFSHSLVQPATVEQYVTDDRVRRLLVDAETTSHTWAVRVMQWLPRRPSIFFDGIGGDILGDPVGWSVLFGLAVEPRSPEEEVDAIVAHTVSDAADDLLRRGRWPEAAAVREDLRDYLRPFQTRPNVGELAFLLLRQRRSISLWSQQLLPPGHLVVCPYLDLDYLRLLLDFRSTDKHATKFQRACLREFWPRLYKYPGNRDIPPDLPPGSSAPETERGVRCLAALRTELETCGATPLLRELLTVKRRALFELSKRSESVAARSIWSLNPLIELVVRQMSGSAGWPGEAP